MSGVRTRPDPDDELLDDPNVRAQIERTGVSTDPGAPGVFEGAGKATIEGIPRGIHEAGATAMTVGGGLVNRGIWLAQSLVTEGGIDNHAPLQAIDDAYDERQALIDAEVEKDLKRARDLRPDPMTSGAAALIGNDLAAMLPRTSAATALGNPLRGAVAAGAPAGQAEADRLEAAGVDPETAGKAGAFTGAALGVGALLPAGNILKGAIPDALAAAGGNVGLGVANRAAVHQALLNGGYTDQAAQYQAWDGTAILTDAAFSLLLSGGHHVLGAKRTEAVLTQRVADFFREGDGLVPVDRAAAEASAAAKTNALDALLAGEPIHVADRVEGAGFVSTEPTHDPHQLRDAVAFIVDLESGGRLNAKNPNSSATGPGQFIDATWLATLSKHRPDLVEGKTKAQQLALRTDPTIAREMLTRLTEDNAAALRAKGVEPTRMALYLAHHFGAKRVPGMLGDLDAPMESILTPKELEANPTYRGKSVREVVAGFAKRARGARDNLLARESADLVDSHLEELGARSRDGLLSKDEAAALRKEDADLEALLRQHYTQQRDNVLAANPLRDGEVAFAEKRRVEIRSALERSHSAVAFGRELADFQAKLDKLPDSDAALIALAAKLRGPVRRSTPRIAAPERAPTTAPAAASPKVSEPAAVAPGMVRLYHGGEADDGSDVAGDVHFSTSRDYARAYAAKSGGGGRVYWIDVPESELDGDIANGIVPRSSIALPAERARAMKPVDEPAPAPAALDAAASSGEPPESTRAAASGEQGAELSTDIAAAREIAAELPDEPVLVGTDADGEPIYRSVREVLADIEKQVKQEELDAEAYARAASCFLRRGG